MKVDSMAFAQAQFESSKERKKTEKGNAAQATQRVIQEKTHQLDKTCEAAGIRADGKRTESGLQCAGGILAAVGGAVACAFPIGTIIGAILLIAAAICFAVAGAKAAEAEEKAAKTDLDGGQAGIRGTQTERAQKDADEAVSDERETGKQRMNAALQAKIDSNRVKRSVWEK